MPVVILWASEHDFITRDGDVLTAHEDGETRPVGLPVQVLIAKCGYYPVAKSGGRFPEYRGGDEILLELKDLGGEQGVCACPPDTVAA
jgi:hypothetical protein